LLVLLGIYHTVVALLYGNSFNYFLYICVSAAVYLVVGYMLVLYLQGDRRLDAEPINAMLLIYVAVVSVNALLIVLEYSSPQLKQVVEGILAPDPSANIQYGDSFRNRGLAQGGGAGLSVANAIGIWACISLWSRGAMGAPLCLLAVVCLNAANIFTGRTGLLVGLVFDAGFAVLALARLVKSRRVSIWSLVGIAAVAWGLVAAGQQITVGNDVLGWAFEWAKSGNGSSSILDTASAEDLRSMLFLPTNVVHLVFGVGFFDGVGWVYPRTDSGYLKTLLSVGLPLAAALYGWVLWSFAKIGWLGNGLKILTIPLVIMMAGVEIKEPFLYQNCSGRFVFAMIGAYLAVRAVLRRKASLDRVGE